MWEQCTKDNVQCTMYNESLNGDSRSKLISEGTSGGLAAASCTLVPDVGSLVFGVHCHVVAHTVPVRRFS